MIDKGVGISLLLSFMLQMDFSEISSARNPKTLLSA